jgi:hypothetical protein
LTVQRLPQKSACAVQSGFDGLGSDPKVRRCFLDAHVFHVAQDENEAEGLRKVIHGGFQKFPYFALRRGAFGICVCGHGRKLNNLCARFLLRFNTIQGHRGPLLAFSPQCLVQSDPRQPSAKRCVAAKLREIGEREQIGLLHHVLRFTVVLHHGARHTVKPSIVRFHDRTKCGRIAPRCALNKLTFAKCLSIRVLVFLCCWLGHDGVISSAAASVQV